MSSDHDPRATEPSPAEHAPAHPFGGVVPEGAFRFQLGLRTGGLREFFEPTDKGGEILAERRHWLRTDGARHTRMSPEGRPLLGAFSEMLRQWGHDGVDGSPGIEALGAAIEPDFMLLSPDDSGALCLRAGVVCFPSSWSLEGKLGRTIDFIHSGVPGLNDQLGARIRRFFARLKPGRAFRRENWGLAATAERNMHPDLGRPRLTRDAAEEGVWLRIEHQVFGALPDGHGVVFGIRIGIHPLRGVLACAAAKARLNHALATMEPAVASYKGLAAALPALLALTRP